jgi:peptide/nickel transport system substrate-binding protein
MSEGVRTSLTTAALTALALAALLLTGCGGTSSTAGAGAGDSQPVRGGSMDVSQNEEVTTFDPSEAITTQSIIALSQIMESLYKIGSAGHLEADLAVKGRATNDERTWTFDLRHGVKFSNGKPLTAEDVVFSLNLARTSTYYSGLFEAIKTVRATSPTQVVLQCDQPLPAMKALLSSWAAAVVPKDYGGASEKHFAEHPIGTGPFVLARWDHGRSVTLARNPDYWNKALPYLDRVALRTTSDPSSRVNQLRGGDLVAIEKPPFSQIEELENTPGLSVGQYAFGYSQYVILNAKSSVFENQKLKEAVSLVIDRKAIVDTALSGHAKIGTGGFLAPPILYHDPEVKLPTRDPEKAKELVKEAKAENAPTRVTFLYSNGTAYQQLASQIVQQELEEIGFEVKLQPLDESAYFEKQAEGAYDITLGALGPGVLDPSENVALFVALEGMYSHSDMSEIAKLAEEGKSETDPARRKQIYYEIQEVVAKEGYVITVAYEPYVWGLNDKVTGFAINGIGLPWFSEFGVAKE